MYKKRLGSKAIAAACGLGLAASLLGAASPVIAEEIKGTSGSTEVQVRADTSNMKFRVPTVIRFAANADGTLTTPSDEAANIENLSVFSIHVTGMKVKAGESWNIVADKQAAANASTENNIAFSVGPDGAPQNAADAMSGEGIDLSANSAFNMTYQDGADDTLELLSAGSVAKVDGKQLTGEGAKVATITWTLAPGNAS